MYIHIYTHIYTRVCVKWESLQTLGHNKMRDSNTHSILFRGKKVNVIIFDIKMCKLNDCLK